MYRVKHLPQKVKIFFVTAIIVLSIIFIFGFSTQDNIELVGESPPLSAYNFHLMDRKEDVDTYIRKQMGICYKNGKNDCYKQVASLFFYQFKLADILNLFATNEADPSVFSRCHEVTHYLSRMEYAKKKNLPKVFATCNFTCHGGCYHGAIEEYLKEKNLLSSQDYEESLRREIPKICGRKEDFSVPLAYGECIHGIGHGAMYIFDGDIFNSLHACDLLSSLKDREGCYSGVFMENSSSSTNTDHPGKFIRQDDPMYPCNILEEKYLPLCYRYQSSYFATLTNHDWKKTIELCMGIPQRYWNDCFQTIGTNQVGFTQDLQLIKRNCELMPSAQAQDICVSGVVISFAGRFVNDASKILAFCSAVDESNKKACFQQMGLSIRSWSKNAYDTRTICNFIARPQYSSLCKGGQ